jgi:TRAP-type C4-dicarboxylate transport system permease small subunit
MTTLSSVSRVLARFMYVVAGIALTACVFLTVCDVLLRLFKHPIIGTYELVGLLGAVVVGFSLPETSRLNGHVFMHFLTDRLSESVKGMLRVLTRILAIGMFLIIAWNLMLMGHDFQASGETTATLQLPFFPVCYGIAVCCFVECLVLFAEIFKKGETQS